MGHIKQFWSEKDAKCSEMFEVFTAMKIEVAVSGLWRRVVLRWYDTSVSEDHVTSMLRVNEDGGRLTLRKLGILPPQHRNTTWRHNPEDCEFSPQPCPTNYHNHVAKLQIHDCLRITKHSKIQNRSSVTNKKKKNNCSSSSSNSSNNYFTLYFTG
jgi:hypothetical protein